MTYVRTAVSASRRHRFLLRAAFLAAATATAIFIAATSTTSFASPTSSAIVTAVSCGYPQTTGTPLQKVAYNESEVLRYAEAFNTDARGDRIVMYYNDEHALDLGASAVTVNGVTTSYAGNTVAYPGTPPAGGQSPVKEGAPYYTPAQLGDNAATVTALNLAIHQGTLAPAGAPGNSDVSGRPNGPALFLTDLTVNGASSKAGDWQNGGAPIVPNTMYGSWKYFTETITNTTVSLTGGADPAKNNWTLGTGSDTPSVGFAALSNQGFGTELSWNLFGAGGLGLLKGHLYRVEIMDHDGDQNKSGGDSGVACFTVQVPDITTTASHTAFNPTTGVATISDDATVSGTSNTGTVTFNAYGPFPISTTLGNFTCTAANKVAGPITSSVGSNGHALAGPVNVSSAGLYVWTADLTLAGAGSAAASSGCNSDQNEVTQVDKLPTSLLTDGRNNGGEYELGSGVLLHDTATLSGGTNDAAGTLTFRLYDKTDVNCSGVPLGTQSVAVNGANGQTYTTTTASSGSFTVTAGGTYHWTAIYVSSDAKNGGSSDPASNFGSSCSTDNVPVGNYENPVVLDPKINVTKNPPNQSVNLNGTATFHMTVTNIGNTGLTNVIVDDPVVLGITANNCGRTASQTAPLIAAVGNHNATFDPGESFTYDCTGGPVTAEFTNVAQACGDDKLGTTVCDTTDDGGNPPPGCPPATEASHCGHVSIEDLHSKQDFVPNDKVIISGLNDANGKLSVALYKGACTQGNLILGPQQFNVSGTGGTFTTTNTAKLSTLLGTDVTDGTYNWLITYSQDTHNNADIIGGCGDENFVVTNH